MTGRLWTFDARGAADPVGPCLDALASAGMIVDAARGRAAIEEREQDGSTYVGRATALPHIIGEAARTPGILAARCDPLRWGDAEVGLLIFLIAPSVDGLAQDGLGDVMHRLVVIGIDAPTDRDAHHQTLRFLTESGATTIKRKREQWA